MKGLIRAHLIQFLVGGHGPGLEEREVLLVDVSPGVQRVVDVP